MAKYGRRRRGRCPTARRVRIRTHRRCPIDTAERLARELRNLPADVEVVAYCRGPFCLLADDAVRRLRRKRRTARVEDDFAEWRYANLPIKSLIVQEVTS